MAILAQMHSSVIYNAKPNFFSTKMERFNDMQMIWYFHAIERKTKPMTVVVSVIPYVVTEADLFCELVNTHQQQSYHKQETRFNISYTMKSIQKEKGQKRAPAKHERSKTRQMKEQKESVKTLLNLQLFAL